MSYQKCPKCNGTGLKYQLLTGRIPYGEAIDAISTAGYPYKDKEGNLQWQKPDNTCLVCKGAMIISELTGLPPNKKEDDSIY